jgi:hypothetical protein
VAYALRFSSALLGTGITRSTEPVTAPDLSKRSVVAFRKRSLRSVELECGQTPKEVLSGAFKNLRRAASTTSSMRMSRRFARTSHDGPPAYPGADPWVSANSEDWAWRPIGDVALTVMRSAALSAAVAKLRLPQ